MRKAFVRALSLFLLLCPVGPEFISIWFYNVTLLSIEGKYVAVFMSTPSPIFRNTQNLRFVSGEVASQCPIVPARFPFTHLCLLTIFRLSVVSMVRSIWRGDSFRPSSARRISRALVTWRSQRASACSAFECGGIGPRGRYTELSALISPRATRSA